MDILHIPRTGGTALRVALASVPGVHCLDHDTTLSQIPEGTAVGAIVRDPVTRFVSAFGHSPTGWDSPDEMALAIDTEAVRDILTSWVVFLPRSHWLDTPRPLAWLGHTETLDADLGRLSGLIGHHLTFTRRNAGPPPRPLSARAIDNLRDWYADDYALLAKE